MNYFTIAAGLLATFACIGHFTMGTKDFLRPILQANVALIPRKVMQSLFHYMSVILVLTAVLLLSFGFGHHLGFEHPKDIILLWAVLYLGLGIAQFAVALTLPVKGNIFRLFQWIFWLLISAFCFLSL
ncbi:hypothetical protein [Persicobacter psychrovividus]|uniref:DUF423 domain-containing protein n=1 Tax=Persicobacter psychrovividus TaxID=387638 RepID=A0ABM7VHD7_9BACT|nr:hypothetical protein PEPS_26700 [Persicobacter psychrovividus]